MQAFDVKPDEHCFKTPVCKFGAAEIQKHAGKSMNDVEVIIVAASAITCLNEPNSDQECRDRYKCAVDAEAKVCGVTVDSDDFAMNKMPEKFRPCEDVDAHDMMFPVCFFFSL